MNRIVEHIRVFALQLTIIAVATALLSFKTDHSKPNIIFILADDLGWSELPCYGNTFNETPNLDQLAKEGIRFTQAYASAPVCSPYRASLLTGQYPARVGITDYLRPQDKALSMDHTTFPELLRANGYNTAMIGKWHLTGYEIEGAKEEVRAVDHGFNEELVTEQKGVGNGANYYPYHFRTDTISWTTVTEKKLKGNEYLTDRINYEAVEFIERNKSNPFFLYISHFAPHSILNGKKELVDKYTQKYKSGKVIRDGNCYLCQDSGLDIEKCTHWASDHNPHLAAMLESIDDGVGLIIEKLKELGIEDNTIIVFTSDNGGESNVTDNGILRGGKSQLYEGGIREPLIVKWKNTIKENSSTDVFTANVDFYPTFLGVAGIQPDENQQLDGISILPVLKDSQTDLTREAFYWHYPLDRNHFLGGRSSGAIRMGDWKLIEYFNTGKLEMYNIAEDIEEKNELSEQYPDKAEHLHTQLKKWRTELNAKTDY